MSITLLIVPVGKERAMKRYRVFYIDEVQANSEEEAYEETLKYLQDCIKNQDVSAFNYELIGEITWKPVELKADYWIIQESNGYDEYKDEVGDNLMFTTKDEAQEKIDQINKEFFNRITNNLLGETNA
jgi:hypothetical protein